jgi:serine kinase of HPr protein (carbohydrate metabolism regulator)
MTAPRPNVHGTAIVVGTTGLLFVGPSGTGKSSLAYSCIAEAQSQGLFSALIADDQVFLSAAGGRVIAECPPTIAGMLELRGTGIVRLAHISPALIHFAVIPADCSGAGRLPPDEDRIDLLPDISLPVIRIPAAARNPLALIRAKIPLK